MAAQSMFVILHVCVKVVMCLVLYLRTIIIHCKNYEGPSHWYLRLWMSSIRQSQHLSQQDKGSFTSGINFIYFVLHFLFSRWIIYPVGYTFKFLLTTYFVNCRWVRDFEGDTETNLKCIQKCHQWKRLQHWRPGASLLLLKKDLKL